MSEPRIKIEPLRAGSDGEEATLLMHEYGSLLDDWQGSVISSWLSTDKDGRYIVTSAGLSLARQNGKNVCLEALCFFGLVVNGERILWTSHRVSTSKKAFQRLSRMFSDTRHPEITRLVQQIVRGVGEWAIILKNGGSVEFTSRSRQTARGFDGISRVIFDEAQELTDDQSEAVTAVLSASATGTRQIIYCGTPVYPGCVGTVFRRFRQSCIEAAGRGEVEGVSWYEWSPPFEKLDDIDITDRELWKSCNPALPGRLTMEFTAQEAALLSKDGFCRERLGWWAPTISEETAKAIDEQLWDACKSSEPKPEGKTAYGVKFSADGSTVALSGACISSDNIARISLIEVRPMGAGLSWLADWLNERYEKASCVVIDGRNGADLLVDKISPVWKMKNSVIKPSAKDILAAVSLLMNELSEHSLTWYDKQEALRESALSSVKRGIAGGWGFGGAGCEVIESASLALWGVRTSKRNPTRKMLIG